MFKRDEDVPGLYVQMHQLLAVDVLQPLGYMGHDFAQLSFREAQSC